MERVVQSKALRVFIVIVVIAIILGVGYSFWQIVAELAQSRSTPRHNLPVDHTIPPAPTDEKTEQHPVSTQTPTYGFKKTTKPEWGPQMLMASSTIFGGVEVTSNIVHFIWASGNHKIMYRRSTDNGESWSMGVVIASGNEVPLTDPIASDGSTLHIIYKREGNLFYRRSLDEGLTWDRETLLMSGEPGFRFSITASDSSVHLVWSYPLDAGGGSYYRRSINNGLIWEPRIQLVQDGQGGSRTQLASFGNTVHMAWFDAAGYPSCSVGKFSFKSCPEIYYRRSLDNGKDWEPAIRISSDPAVSIRPELVALDSNLLVMTWTHFESNSFYIYTASSKDNGVTWSAPQQISSTGGADPHPVSEGKGSSVHLMWQDDRDGNQEIYYRISADGGKTWSKEERVTISDKLNTMADIAATQKYAHLVYTEGSDMYYRRRTLDTK